MPTPLLSPRALSLAIALSAGTTLAVIVPPAHAQAPAAPAAAGGGPNTSAGRAPGFMQFPSISPDGKTIVFSWAGDLWAVPSGGGMAERITTSTSDEERSAFSADGTMLAFDSERDGPKNLYVMPVTRGAAHPTFGEPRRVTISDRPQALGGFTADGKRLVFSTGHEPAIYRSARMYSAPIDAPAGGGSVMTRLTEAFGTQARGTPDGKAVLFTRGRVDPTRPRYTGSGNTDLWQLNTGDGSFKRLTTFEGQDADAFGLPDGSIVFVSGRDGQNNLYRLRAGASDSDAGAVEAITSFKPGGEAAGAKLGATTISHGVRDLAVANGGTTAVFVVWDTLYTLDLKTPGAKPASVNVTVAGDTGQLDFTRANIGKQAREAALSPDGKTMAAAARGEIFVRSSEKDRPTRRVTNSAAKDGGLAWSSDGRMLYFDSDASGVSGIYAATVVMSREDVAPEPKDAVKEPAKDEAKKDEAKKDEAKPDDAKKDETKDDKKDDKKKPDEGKRWAESLTFATAPIFTPDGVETTTPRPSPDGKRMLVTQKLGDLVLLNLDEKGQIVPGSARTIYGSWNEADVQWTADSRHIIYAVEDLNFNSDIWLHDLDAAAGTPEAAPVSLTRHPDFDHAPRLSADGKVLVYLSDRASDSNGRDDIYYVSLDRSLDGLRPYELAEYFKDAAEKAKKRKPLGADAKPEPKKDAKKDDAKPNEANADEAKKDEPAAEKKADDKKDGEKKDSDKKDDKKDAGPSPTKPLTFDSADAWKRARKLVDIGGDADAGQLQITPAGDRIIFSVGAEAAGGTPSLVSVDYKGAERKTVATGAAGNVSVSLTGDKVIFVQAGDPAIGKPVGGEVEKLPIDAPVVIDVAAQQRQKFLEAARTIGSKFYHPTLKGLDWTALTARYLSLAEQTRTDPEFNRVFLNMLGELNGSHLGITGGRNTAGAGEPCGYLGIDVRPAPGGYEVARILAGGSADKPALRNSQRLVVGDVITAINGRQLGSGTTFDGPPAIDLLSALAGTPGQDTLLSVRPATGAAKSVLIVPQSGATDTLTRYADEVARNTAKVSELSGGKLGYLHIRGMDLASVRDFERDLFAAADGKQGLIIDVRDNGGGSTADILLSSLTAPRHTFTVPRGADPKAVPADAYPRDRRLIYGYNRPLNVLINQNSFSNAEIFAHAIKTIKRGTLVGTATYGGVISTGAFTLIDGSTVRLPFRGWYLPDGADLENNGAKPDVDVERLPQDEAAGKDVQLEAAVKELMGRV